MNLSKLMLGIAGTAALLFTAQIVLTAADAAPAGTAQRASSAAPEKEFSEADYQAAYQLLDAMQMRKMSEQTMEGMLNMQLKANPQLQMVRPVLEAFFRKYLAYDSLKKSYADLYLETFSIPEIKELIVFYQTPLGKKIVEKTPTLTVRGAQIGQKAVMDHMDELRTSVMKSIQEQIQKKQMEQQGQGGAAK